MEKELTVENDMITLYKKLKIYVYDIKMKESGKRSFKSATDIQEEMIHVFYHKY